MQKKFMYLLGVALILLTTYAYSALATNLAITGEATFRTPADIRITDVSLNGTPTGATQRYEPIFKKNTITAGFTLDSSSSSISYDVTVTNSGLIDQAIYNFTTLSSNNNGLTILIDGQPINQALPIIVPFGTSRTITITYSSSTPGAVDVINQIDFRKVYYVEYNTKGGSTIATQTKFENVDLTLTTDEPTKTGGIFEGWTDEQDGTTVKFDPGDTYTLNENKILYAIYSDGEYTITFDPQNGESTTQITLTSGDQLGTLPTPTKTGYTLDGWFTSNGTQVYSNTVPTEDITYYAHWTANELTFENQTLNSGTYGNAYTSNAFNEASNGTGSYTYTIVSGAPTGATINSSNRTITFTNSTNAGTYNIVVRATDNDSNVYKDATMKIVINKATPVITLDSNSGTLNAGGTTTVVATVTSGNASSISGTLTATSSNTSIASVAPSSSSVTATNAGVNTNTVITGVAGGTTTISYNFTPTDTNNYNSATIKTYSVTSKNVVSIATYIDNLPWDYIDTFYSMKATFLVNVDDNTSKYYPTYANSSIVFYDIPVGTYKLQALVAPVSSSYNQWAYLPYTISITSDGTIINNSLDKKIDYYTLTLTGGSNISNFKIWFSTAWGGSSPMTKILRYDKQLMIEAIPDAGYHFSSWSVVEGDSPSSLTSNNVPITLTQPTTIHANDAIPNTYQVAFNANGGTGTMSNQSFTYGTAQNLTANAYEYASHTFVGWNTEADGTGTTYLDEVSVSNLTSTNNGTVTLYAQWITANATFDTGLVVNAKMKSLAAGTTKTYLDNDSLITSIEYSSTIPSQYKTSEYVVSSSTSQTKIYMWYDNGVIKWWSEDSNPKLNSDSSYMFSNLRTVTSIDVEDFDTSNATNMHCMFFYCMELANLDLSNFNTSNVTDMGNMFYGCQDLIELDLSNFNTSNVTDMSYMIFDCENLTSLDLSNFNTSNVTDMQRVFEGCSSLELLDLSNFNTSNVKNMNRMFYGCTSLETIFASDDFVTTAVTNSTNMFYNCTSINGGNGTYYAANHIDKTYAKIDHGQSDPGYFRYKATSNVRAVDLYYDNSNTGMTCETAQCALDNISRILRRAGAISTGNDYLCKRATSSQLHKETCNNNTGDMYCADIEGYGNTITYGQVGTSGTLASGDAFICDVNGDGTYNATNEMFYYVSNYFDTSTKTSNTEYATLVYYNNVSAGEPSARSLYNYDSKGQNWYGPRTAINQLPTSIQWQDVGLYKNSRAILGEYGSTHNATTTPGGTLPTNFSYKGYSSRLLTAQELMNACGLSQMVETSRQLDSCKYLFENTSYSEIGSVFVMGSWLETVSLEYDSSGWHLLSSMRRVSSNGVNADVGVRPVIEVKKTDIQY